MKKTLPCNKSQFARDGFTLVEMLVATALVVLMMLMFAQVFQTSAGLVSNQKGMAELDQSVRTVTTLLQGDIRQRTFRDVVPFQPIGLGDPPVLYEEEKSGFFSISENDASSSIDDVLHLTLKATQETSTSGSSPPLPFYGKATLIRYVDPDPGANPRTNPTDANIDEPMERQDYLNANRNQPEFDDGYLDPITLLPGDNGTGSSRYAEVCWFLRNGNLYRRSFLIREPYDTGETESTQPQDASERALIPGTYSALNVPPIPDSTPAPDNQWHDAVGRFWYDFDYSAYNDPAGTGLTFHTAAESLRNEHPISAGLGSFSTVPSSLGIPCLRYGNSIRRALDAGSVAVPPREFLDATDPTTYIGRFTVQEAAHSEFTYPSQSPATDGPFQNSTPLSLGTDGLVSRYSNETGRRGEDIVMSNVHSFDIKVWDDVLQDFADLGHSRQRSGVNGDYHQLNRNNTLYGTSNNITYGNRFDTWHPNDNMPNPPYRPVDGAGDPKPLRAIQIHIRFYDVGSEQMRDLTFTYSLVDPQ